MADNLTSYRYLVEEDWFPSGPVFTERDTCDATAEKVVSDILSGQIGRPYRVTAFSVGTGHCFDASAIIARAVATAAYHGDITITRGALDFIEEHAGFAYSEGLSVVGELEAA